MDPAMLLISQKEPRKYAWTLASGFVDHKASRWQTTRYSA